MTCIIFDSPPSYCTVISTIKAPTVYPYHFIPVHGTVLYNEQWHLVPAHVIDFLCVRMHPVTKGECCPIATQTIFSHQGAAWGFSSAILEIVQYLLLLSATTPVIICEKCNLLCFLWLS